jgi:hypothetical protein
MNNFIELENGQFLFNDFGKYRPNICYILDQKLESISDLPWGDGHANNYNLEGRSLRVLTGNFWVSKKGNPCFNPCQNGKHHLVREDWGGGGDRGDLFENKDFLYFRRASSNGGGQGITYAVIPCGWTKKISLEDI